MATIETPWLIYWREVNAELAQRGQPAACGGEMTPYANMYSRPDHVARFIHVDRARQRGWEAYDNDKHADEYREEQGTIRHERQMDWLDSERYP